MLKLVILAVILATLAAAAMAILFAITMLAVAAMVVVPLYLLGRHLAQQRSARPMPKPIERLQNLYAEGQIDLFEFERRVEHLVALEN